VCVRPQGKANAAAEPPELRCGVRVLRARVDRDASGTLNASLVDVLDVLCLATRMPRHGPVRVEPLCSPLL